MTLSDLIAFSALIVSIFALPISYILGARGLKIQLIMESSQNYLICAILFLQKR